jgi:hypothetical protein
MNNREFLAVTGVAACGISSLAADAPDSDGDAATTKLPVSLDDLSTA